MKTLLFLRHGKSSWSEAGPDHDRPLKKRGRRDARRMGALVAEEGIVPDYVWCSTAARAVQTVERFLETAESDVAPVFTEALYCADADEIIAVVSQTPDDAAVALTVGHNPGTAEAIEALTGLDAHVPTCTLAAVELPIASWTELHAAAKGTLAGLWHPRELDPIDSPPD